MKKFVTGIFSLVIITALCLSLSSCTFYNGNIDYYEKDGVHYIVSGYVKRCFVTDIEFPAGVTEHTVTIPDKIESGHVVEGIGGFVGIGVRYPCDIFFEDELLEHIYGDEYDQMLEYGEFIDYTLTINVGKNVNNIFFYDFSPSPYLYLKQRTENDTTVTEDTNATESCTCECHEQDTACDSDDERNTNDGQEDAHNQVRPIYYRIKIIINVDSENPYYRSENGVVFPIETE